MELNFNISFCYDWNLQKYYKIIKSVNHSSKYFDILKQKNQQIKETKRTSNMKIITQIIDTGIFLKEIPGRINFDLAETSSSSLKRKISANCVLCDSINSPNMAYPLTLGKYLIWRGYIIKPNTFPYFKDHYLILSSIHNEGKNNLLGTQIDLHHNPNIIKDMLDFYALNNYIGTMFFNGTIGNSQLHFHFHHINEDLPIEKYLMNWNKFNFETFSTKNNSKLILFSNSDKYCFNGILLIGKTSSLAKDCFTLIANFSKKKYLYNLVFIKPHIHKDEPQVIIYLRSKNKLNKSFDLNMGASSLAGIHTETKFTKSQLKKNILKNKIDKYCSITVLKPTKKLIKILLK